MYLSCFPITFQCLYRILAEENNGVASPEEAKPEVVEKEDKEEGWLDNWILFQLFYVLLFIPRNCVCPCDRL